MSKNNRKGSVKTSSLSVGIEPIFTGKRLVKTPTEIVTYQCDKPDLSYEVYRDSEEDAIRIGPHVKRPQKRKSLLPQAKLKDLHDHIPFENVFQLDQDDIDGFNQVNSDNVKELFELMLNRHASLNIATEVATAQIEALMANCLDSPIEPDIDLPNLG